QGLEETTLAQPPNGPDPILGIGTEGFLGDRPRPCQPAGTPRGDRERLLRGDDAPVKSVSPVGASIPDDAAGAGSGVDNQLGARAEEAPLCHAPVHPIGVQATFRSVW